MELAGKGKAMWSVVVGLVFNAFLITNLILKLTEMSISAIFVRIVEVYRDAIGFFFFPFEFLFDVDVPWYVQDLIAIWVVSGQIGTIVRTLLSRLMYDQAAGVVEKFLNPDVRQRLIETRGAEFASKEIKFAEEQVKINSENLKRWKLIAFANVFAGPLFAIQIWRHSAVFPGTRISGRGLIIGLSLMLLFMLIVYIVLNFFTL